MLFLISGCLYATEEAIKVLGFEPQPNYKLTTNASDIADLTNDKLESYPMWTKSSAVGWQARTPVVMTIKVSGKQNKTVRFRFAKGLHAGVDLPRRIDVYMNGDVPHYISGREIDSKEYPDRSHQWIGVDIGDSEGELSVVIHARGAYMMIDEINVHDTYEEIAYPARPNESTVSADGVKQDSVRRLKEQVLSASALPEWHLVPEKLLIGLPEVYEDLSSQKTDYLTNGVFERTLTGYPGSYENIVVGLRNNTNHSEKVFIHGMDRSILEIFEIMPVIASNGKKAWDALLPVKESTISIPPVSSAYLWLKVGFDNQEWLEKIHRLSFLLDSDEKIGELTLTLEKLPLHKDIKWPDVNVWSYSHHVPVKKFFKRNVEWMHQQHINVFVVHTSKIPTPFNYSLNKKIESRFDAEISALRGKGKILLYMSWPEWIPKKYRNDTPAFRQLLGPWLRYLTAFMKKRGLEYEDWALYLIDEPKGNELELLAEFSSMIKSIDNEVQIYANPITTRSVSTWLSDLEYARKYVDIWQPEQSFGRKYSQSFFSRVGRPWWTYSGVKSPAKAASPSKYYAIPMRAWAAGASGTGFWSLTETNKSSAWDDFDGIKPDWAAVYESDIIPVSSRRWEAFKDAVEDFALYRTIQLSRDGSTNAVDANLSAIRKILDEPDINWTMYWKKRRELLGGLYLYHLERKRTDHE